MTENSIHISEENPWYWSYDGEPTLLVGGTNTDNLFQWTGDHLRDHLDELVAAGGNYVRNTLSDRGGNDIHPFAEVHDGHYDLEQWNGAYWERLELFLDETAKRDIVVQLTLWDQHDLSSDHPWYHENNINYGRYDSGLAGPRDLYDAVDRNEVVYPYLERFVNRVLETTLDYDHILYNVSNECRAGEEWERHWAEYIHEQARQAGEKVAVTSMHMWPGRSVATALRYPEIISYVEVSQANQNSKGYTGRAHWDHLQSWREEVSETVGPRPFNNVKVYGSISNDEAYGSPADAVTRFWRNILGGCAAVRFHRPVGADGQYGIGLTEHARPQIQSARLLTEKINLFGVTPSTELLSARTSDEIYCAADVGREYVIYFRDGGAVDIDLSAADGSLTVHWLNTDDAAWTETSSTKGSSQHALSAPGSGNWIAIIRA